MEKKTKILKLIKEMKEKQLKGDEREYFYFNNILPVYLDDLIKEHSDLENKYDLLISNVGLSPATTVIMTNVIKPKEIYYIGTEKSIDEKYKFINKYTEIVSLKKHSPVIVDEHDISNIYKKVLDVINTNKDKQMLLDLTGGKKSLVSTTALLGTIKNISIGYIDFKEYLEDLRSPVYSTEYVHVFENPYYLNGEKHLNDSLNLFNSHRYKLSSEKMNVSKENSRLNREMNLLEKLSNAYYYWDNFNHSKALEEFNNIINIYTQKEINRFGVYEIIKNHILLLKNTIIKDKEIFQILDYYFAAIRKAKVHDYNIALFLLYRSLEKIMSYEMNKIDIDVSNPDYEKLGISFNVFKEKAEEIYGKGKYKYNEFPPEIMLMVGFILLSIKKEKYISDEELKNILNVTMIRNKSHYTHGQEMINKQDFDIGKRTTAILICKELKKKKDWIRIQEDFKFPEIRDF